MTQRKSNLGIQKPKFMLGIERILYVYWHNNNVMKSCTSATSKNVVKQFLSVFFISAFVLYDYILPAI